MNVPNHFAAEEVSLTTEAPPAHGKLFPVRHPHIARHHAPQVGPYHLRKYSGQKKRRAISQILRVFIDFYRFYHNLRTINFILSTGFIGVRAIQTLINYL